MRTPYDAVYHYHSIYDSQRWQEVYGDIGFVRHVRTLAERELTTITNPQYHFALQVAVSKHLGLVLLRLADSIILPLNTTHYASELDMYLDKYVL